MGRRRGRRKRGGRAGRSQWGGGARRLPEAAAGGGIPAMSGPRAPDADSGSGSGSGSGFGGRRRTWTELLGKRASGPEGGWCRARRPASRHSLRRRGPRPLRPRALSRTPVVVPPAPGHRRGWPPAGRTCRDRSYGPRAEVPRGRPAAPESGASGPGCAPGRGARARCWGRTRPRWASSAVASGSRCQAAGALACVSGPAGGTALVPGVSSCE